MDTTTIKSVMRMQVSYFILKIIVLTLNTVCNINEFFSSSIIDAVDEKEKMRIKKLLAIHNIFVKVNDVENLNFKDLDLVAEYFTLLSVGISRFKYNINSSLLKTLEHFETTQKENDYLKSAIYLKAISEILEKARIVTSRTDLVIAKVEGVIMPDSKGIDIIYGVVL